LNDSPSDASDQKVLSDPYNEEIDVASYIRIIIKRKWMIVIGTLLCLVGSIIYTAQKKGALEARALLLVVPSPYKTELTPPMFSMDVYLELAKAQDLMQAIIDTLDLRDKKGKKLSIPVMNGILKTELGQVDIPSQNSSPLVHLVATTFDTTLFTPVSLVNAWAELFVRKNSGISSQETGGSYEFISEQYEIARSNLQKAENDLHKFNEKNNTGILKADLAPTSTRLVEYQANMVNMSLELNNLEEDLDALEKYLLAVETTRGQWVGALDIQGSGNIQHHRLDRDQQRVLDTTIKHRNNVKALREEVRSFSDDQDLQLMGDDLQLKRSTLITYMNELSKIEVDMYSTSQILKETKKEDIERLIRAGAFVETLPAETLREFASLYIGYNLLIPRQTYLILEIERLRAETDSLENVYTDNSLDLALLQEKLTTAEQPYQALLEQYRATKSRINSLKLSINALRPKVKYQKVKRAQLELKTGSLVAQIAQMELEQKRLDRNITVYASTFDKFSKLLEDARVAKANQPNDVKIVAKAVESVGQPIRTPSKAMAIGFGLVGMIFLAFFLEQVERARERL
jgi:uncharacterized protein involved in exopolysaccharide biosynthesis